MGESELTFLTMPRTKLQFRTQPLKTPLKVVSGNASNEMLIFDQTSEDPLLGHRGSTTQRFSEVLEPLRILFLDPPCKRQSTARDNGFHPNHSAKTPVLTQPCVKFKPFGFFCIFCTFWDFFGLIIWTFFEYF